MHIFMVRTHTGDVYRLPLDKSSLWIGRGHENDLNLDDPTVSRKHARVESRGGGLYVSDRGSRGGTLLNGSVVEDEALLHPGDRISLGTSEITFDPVLSAALEMEEGSISPTAPTTAFPVERVTPHLRTPRPAAASDPALLSLILEADRELTLHRPLEEMYQRLLDLATKVAPGENGALLTVQPEGLVVQAHRSSNSSAGRFRICRSLAHRAMNSKEALLVHDATIDPRHVTRPIGDAEHSRSVICAPLWNDQETIGVLYVDATRKRAFGQRQLEFLTHLGYIAAVKLENKRLFDEAVTARALQEELRSAAEIQREFLPKAAPEIPGYGISGFTRPCFAVGGDFYQYFDFGNGRYGVVLGDVAGKGLAAALLASSFHAMLSLMVDGIASPEDTVGKLNTHFCERVPANRFITLFFGVLDTDTNVLSYVNAGQNYPLVLRPGSAPQRLGPGGLPLGIVPGVVYRRGDVSMEPGSTLLIYSDGVTDLHDPTGAEFGLERLEELAPRLAAHPARKMVSGIIDAADRFGDEDVDDDDLTLVVLRRATEGRGADLKDVTGA